MKMYTETHYSAAGEALPCVKLPSYDPRVHCGAAIASEINALETAIRAERWRLRMTGGTT
jgi:hypothetical protein